MTSAESSEPTPPMSPVAPRKERNPRTVALGLLGVVVGIVLLLVVFVFAIPSLTESGNVKVKLGTDTFDAGLSDQAGRRHPPGRTDPVLRRGQRPERHLPPAPRRRRRHRVAGVRRPPHRDQPRLHVDVGRGRRPVHRPLRRHRRGPADGSGLKQYQVVVTESGTVVINLDPDNPIPSSSTTSASTTTTLRVTGTTPG